MAEKSKAQPKRNPQAVEKDQTPRCLSIFDKGIHTSKDFALGMSGLMSDLIDGRITPSVGNATCNAGGKLLKVIELQHKYGTKRGEDRTELFLT